jgi:hypothetical protein
MIRNTRDETNFGGSALETMQWIAGCRTGKPDHLAVEDFHCS